MAEVTLNADGEGSYLLPVYFTGEDDTVAVNVTQGFRGSIVVSGHYNDGEIESLSLSLPDGWRLALRERGRAAALEVEAWVAYDIFDAGGALRGPITISANYISVPCFTRDTWIETAGGPVLIQNLTPGDLVMTRDHGARPIRWIGKRNLDADELETFPSLRPVRIKAGALGRGVPQDDLLVSQQHRMLVRSRIARRLFESAEVLIAAKQLLQVEGIDIAEDVSAVEYYHMMFDQHEVVSANGAPTESLYTGAESMRAISPAAQEEIFTLFPELRDYDDTPPPARPLASSRAGRRLVVRHLKNNLPLLSP
ncbi:Hint domain-containing protein [Ketogulonicigenium vulgare]|uniref:Hemolysin-type calcium-binding region n=1 Tax=Ketogulonicigenium vulgare (strain WSH-001) TaxID=759362 RepID=F9YAI4_KETVW|nr:Hint domain-containing protein [Ketogulonicigenium vulgare]ADO43221.1 hemolysin-type calcium-binding region [Ketogulonicigenium vulgare Y25]AEM41515.1 Hemolysin-type calcium-binding region [Ketogulonicigenium vulgare WSH-001]ALJ81640.1 hemolysin [Ketogulonicigenium vulgare]ANW34311.1 hemolysin [Ketogulonicigenium vulgare]AOZ55257.1 hemolysin-type calcium-binding region [Ketogulonicigenium vulgare]